MKAYIAEKAKVKHIVLFAVACVMLAGALFWAFALVSLWLAPPQVDAPVEEYGPLGILGVAVVGAAYGLASLMGMLFFGISWGGGQIISLLLAMEKGNKPRRLWIASQILACAHGAVLLAMIGIRMLI